MSASRSGIRRLGPRAVLVVLGAALLAVTIVVSVPSDPPGPAVVTNALDRAITTARDKLARRDQDPRTWAELGAAYVEAARAHSDPTYYPKAEAALRKSLAQQADGNGKALAGLGALANARHDFAAARDWGEKAKAVLPDNAEVYGVLTDAYTQLGDTEAATTALQRMLDLKPGVSSFTRAAYEFELHGRVDDARNALDRALADAIDPGDIVFCRHLLGELAFDNGDVDTAERHYDAGLRAVPDAASLLQGKAMVAAARGRTQEALTGFQALVFRQPNLGNLQAYALLLTSTGDLEGAGRQYTIIEQQQKVDADSGANIDLEASLVAVDRGNAAQALELAEAEWARRHPVFVADAVAWALHLNGRDTEALPYTDQAARTGWRNATFLYHRGMILAGLGRKPEAVTALAEALRINPNFSAVEAHAARTTLARLRDAG
ncbi:Tetratricopeptide repeat-containing protein [Amycolatopsis xylanica]|uniref:Tetratricopeptide repeat-containing protein n=1 Tax=Amycolatopsis xylanica TaxID=589385 RepID=A0A1H2U795_9PSEU|nr:tetratricopeptide repeat protein [Amycolatopsis xylanica]SDW52026.1 Tetratricopeptide repeat-containing protein [Amycolatopsis xylanica]